MISFYQSISSCTLSLDIKFINNQLVNKSIIYIFNENTSIAQNIQQTKNYSKHSSKAKINPTNISGNLFDRSRRNTLIAVSRKQYEIFRFCFNIHISDKRKYNREKFLQFRCEFFFPIDMWKRIFEPIFREIFQKSFYSDI